ncbi:hypothetical protein [Limosilactobacillus caecicola]|uniref:hypothetical protein n=1 Tax=Limosilactobacillus caecicola TaxID=2941332 RepID=UPI002041E524|nr:hypothetical protein [Limosilactobacillus caecicola]
MNRKELNSMITLNSATTKQFLLHQSLVTDYRPLKNWDSGEQIGITVQATVTDGPAVGKTFTIQIKDPNATSHQLHIGSQISVTEITGIDVRGTTRQDSPYVNYSIILVGNIKVVKTND